jgi:AraC-like DNA-binding protein
VLLFDPADDSCSAILFNSHTHFTVLSMVEAFNRVWVSTTDGLWVIEKETEYVRRLSLTDKRFTATYFDHRTGDLFLGTIDGFAISSPDALLVKNAEQPFMLTALYANNQLHNPSRRSVRYLSEVEFPYDYNNLSFEISDLPYSKEEKTSLIYRMAGLDSRWNVLKSNTNRITYNNLPFGRYRLEVGEADLSGNPQSVRYALSVHITPPWYYSWWAIVIYLLLLGALVIWTLNFFRIKQNLRWERQDKEEIVKNSKAKLRTVAAVPVREDKAVTQDEKFIHQIAQLIEEHLPDPELSVNALCEWTDTGSKQLYRKVKQLTGLTPVEYIKTIRLKKAAVLLRQQKYSVADVMYKVGYSNHSYFSRCFQAEFGVTPKAYKEEVTRT